MSPQYTRLGKERCVGGGGGEHQQIGLRGQRWAASVAFDDEERYGRRVGFLAEVGEHFRPRG